MGRLRKIIEITRGVPWPTRYLSTIALVVTCYGLQTAFGGADHVYLYFVPAVVLAATLFDRGTGFFATLLSAALASVFVVEPRGEIVPDKFSDQASVIAFIAIGLLIASVIEGLHLLTKQLRDATASLRGSLARSERLVAEKAALTAEMNHRIKNNLQLTAAVLAMQARQGNPELAAKLQTAADRVAAMARIHNVVERRDDPTGVPARLFMHGLCADLKNAMIAERDVAVDCSAPSDLALTMDQASTIGLIVNELVTNALKHAFPPGRQGRVDVAISEEGGELLLRVKDDGVGCAEDTPSGLGRRLIGILVAKLGGSLAVDCHAGCDFLARFPRQPLQPSEGGSGGREAGEALPQGGKRTA